MNFIEIIPPIIFFFTYKMIGIKGATIAIAVCSIGIFLISVFMKKRLSSLSIISSIILLIFSSLTIIFDNSTFIKIKPTVVYFIFSICFAFFGKSLLKDMMKKFIEADTYTWNKLSIYWSLFFLCCAIINEIVWRNFSEDFWVNFKVIGMPIFTFTFIVIQMIHLKQYQCKSGSKL